MQNVEAEIQDCTGSTGFEALYFCSGYCQLPVHPDLYDASGVVCLNGTYASTGVLQGLPNALSHFQSSIEPFFSEQSHRMKDWFDKFTFHYKSETGSLEALSILFSTCKK